MFSSAFLQFSSFLKPMYKVLNAESCSGGDTQQPASAAHQSTPHQKTLHPPSASLLYPVVNKEVEQQFLGRGVTS
jgi:hypothetical protein